MPSEGFAFTADISFTGAGFGEYPPQSGVRSLLHTLSGSFSCVIYFSKNYVPDSGNAIRAILVVDEHLPTAVYSKGSSIELRSAMDVLVASGTVTSDRFALNHNHDWQRQAEQVFK